MKVSWFFLITLAEAYGSGEKRGTFGGTLLLDNGADPVTVYKAAFEFAQERFKGDGPNVLYYHAEPNIPREFPAQVGPTAE